MTPMLARQRGDLASPVHDPLESDRRTLRCG